MTHIKVHATTMVRILPALAALSFSMAVPSMGAMSDSHMDIPVAKLGMDLALSTTPQASAQTLTGIDIQKDAEGVGVSISGDGTLLHEATKLGEHRLVIDIPQVSSALRKPLVSVKHPLLKQ